MSTVSGTRVLSEALEAQLMDMLDSNLAEALGWAAIWFFSVVVVLLLLVLVSKGDDDE